MNLSYKSFDLTEMKCLFLVVKYRLWHPKHELCPGLTPMSRTPAIGLHHSINWKEFVGQKSPGFRVLVPSWLSRISICLKVNMKRTSDNLWVCSCSIVSLYASSAFRKEFLPRNGMFFIFAFTPRMFSTADVHERCSTKWNRSCRSIKPLRRGPAFCM